MRTAQPTWWLMALLVSASLQTIPVAADVHAHAYAHAPGHSHVDVARPLSPRGETSLLLPVTVTSTSTSQKTQSTQTGPWTYSAAEPGIAVKPGTELRILCVGDSITAGQSSDVHTRGDWNGYREAMRDMLTEDKVVFAGTAKYGNMTDGWTSAWPGHTIQYIHDHIPPALSQHPNLVLVHAGTNDMSFNSSVSTEGNDPVLAASRLGSLVDTITAALPDAVVLVAVIIPTCRPQNAERLEQYEALIPGVVETRQATGKKVVAVDLTKFPVQGVLEDCIHPDNAGYQLLGRWWYDFITQIPRKWIVAPEGPPPNRDGEGNGNASSPPGEGASSNNDDDDVGGVTTTTMTTTSVGSGGGNGHVAGQSSNAISSGQSEATPEPSTSGGASSSQGQGENKPSLASSSLMSRAGLLWTCALALAAIH